MKPSTFSKLDNNTIIGQWKITGLDVHYCRYKKIDGKWFQSLYYRSLKEALSADFMDEECDEARVGLLESVLK